MTWAPRLVAHCVRIRPTRPAPACSSTVSPGCTEYTDLMSRWAVTPWGSQPRRRRMSPYPAPTQRHRPMRHCTRRRHHWRRRSRPFHHTRCPHAINHLRHGLGHLGAEDERQLMRIQLRPEIGVDEIHAGRLGLDHHLTRSGGGLRLVDERRTSVRRCARHQSRARASIPARHAAAVDGFSDNGYRFAL